MKLVVEIESDNEATNNYEQAAHLLNNVALHLSDGMLTGVIHDLNGNSVGKWHYAD